MIDVQQGPLRPFEKQVVTAKMALVQGVSNIGHHRPQRFANLECMLEDGSHLQRSRLQVAPQRMGVHVDQFAQTLSQTGGVLQVLHPQSAPGDLVLVGRSNPFAGGADLPCTAALPQSLPGAVHLNVKGQDQWAGLADEKT